MFKRFIAGLLTLVLAFAVVPASVFAQTDSAAAAVKFIAAVKTTFDKVKKENEIAQKSTDVSAIMEALVKNSYEFLLEGAMDVSDGEDNMKASFKNVLLSDYATGRILDTVEADVGQIIGASSKIGVSFYMDGSRVAVRLPGVDASYYYYIDANTTEEQWNSSAVGQNFPLTQDDLDSFKTYLNLIKEKSETVGVSPPKGMMDKYVALAVKHMAGGRFLSEGHYSLEAMYGSVATEKITCRLSAAAINNFTKELADTIEKDQQLREYLELVYFGMDELGYDAPGDIISAVTEYLRGSTFEKGVQYSVYVNGGGYAARQELVFERIAENDAEYNVVLGFNLLGRDYLLNEMKLTLDTTASFENSAFTVDVFGDVIPRDGVFDYKVICRNTYNDSGEGQDSSAAFIDFRWDTKAVANNFSFEFAYKDLIDKDVMTVAKTDTEAARFDMSGNVRIDPVNNVLSGDFKNVTASYQGSSFSFNVKYSFKPADPRRLNVADNRFVDLLRLSEAELTVLVEQVMGSVGL